jgi:hypothetical protein
LRLPALRPVWGAASQFQYLRRRVGAALKAKSESQHRQRFPQFVPAPSCTLVGGRLAVGCSALVADFLLRVSSVAGAREGPRGFARCPASCPQIQGGTSGTWAELYCDREARATLSGATADARVGALARQAWVLANSVVCLPSESPHLARAPVAPDKDGEADLVTLLGAAFGSADVVWDISEPASHARSRTQFARCSRCSFVPCAYGGLCGVFLAQATVPYNRLPAASTQRLVCATG